MGNLVLDNQVLAAITTLAKRLKTTREDIVRKAVKSYTEKVEQKNCLMKYAGILEDEEAENILNCVRDSRQNKEAAPRL